MSLKVNIHKQLPHFLLRTDFTCLERSLTAVVGPSGAGKTTLIRLIAGLERPDNGSISLNGTLWTETRRGVALPTRLRNIGFVCQEYTLFPHMSIRGNIRFGAPDRGRADNLLHAFDIHHLRNEKPANVSGGERQRAAFCQALARQPDLLLLDEPFSALDVGTRAFLCDMLAVLKKDLGIPIILVTHDLEEATRLGDTVIAIENGRIAPEWLHRHAPVHIPYSPVTAPTYL